MLLANFKYVCAARDPVRTVMCAIMRVPLARASSRVRLVKRAIRQIKIPTKVSGYTV